MEQVSAGGEKVLPVSGSLYDIIIYNGGAYCSIVEPFGGDYRNKTDWKFKNTDSAKSIVYDMLRKGENMPRIKTALEKKGAII